MCKIKGKYEGETFTGYKCVSKRNGRYYSYWTGVEYVVGKVKSRNVDNTGFCKQTGMLVSFNKSMKGYTGVFVELLDAIREKCSLANCIIRMTISGDLKLAEYIYDGDIVIGKEILSIEEV